MENRFLKIDYNLFKLNITDIQLNILSHIKSHYDNNLDYYYTDIQIYNTFNERYSLIYIKKSIKVLDDLGLITRINSKQFYSDTKKWGNRRVIILNIDKVKELINIPSTDIIVDNLSSNELINLIVEQPTTLIKESIKEVKTTILSDKDPLYYKNNFKLKSIQNPNEYFDTDEGCWYQGKFYLFSELQ